MSEKTVNLTIGERWDMLTILNAFKGKLETLAVLLDDVKKLAISDEEWAGVNLVKTPSDEEVAKLPDDVRASTRQSWKWDETIGLKDASLQAPTVDYVLAEIKRRDDAGEMTVGDVRLLAIQKKLKAL